MQLASGIEIGQIMESSITRATANGNQRLDLPPGFRFHPTDEELVVHYLKNKIASRPLPVPIIAEIDLYKFDPWDLPGKAICGENEWYFFTPRDRKYPNGARPNRAAGSGYWKATGTDKPIVSCGSGGHGHGHGHSHHSHGSSNLQPKLGVKKALVFYKGRPPKGLKTNWIMHEYRLAPETSAKTTSLSSRRSLRLDDWVLCRIYRKSCQAPRVNTGSESNSCVEEVFGSLPDHMQQQDDVDASDAAQLYNTLPRLGSLGRLIMGSVSHPFLDSLVADQVSSASVNTLAPPSIPLNNNTNPSDPPNSWTNLEQLDSSHHLPHTINNNPSSIFPRDIDKRHTMPTNTNIINNNHSMGLNISLANIFPSMHHHHPQQQQHHQKAQCNEPTNGGGEVSVDSANLRWPFADGRPKFSYA